MKYGTFLFHVPTEFLHLKVGVLVNWWRDFSIIETRPLAGKGLGVHPATGDRGEPFPLHCAGVGAVQLELCVETMSAKSPDWRELYFQLQIAPRSCRMWVSGAVVFESHVCRNKERFYRRFEMLACSMVLFLLGKCSLTSTRILVLASPLVLA